MRLISLNVMYMEKYDRALDERMKMKRRELLKFHTIPIKEKIKNRLHFYLSEKHCKILSGEIYSLKVSLL